MNKEKCPLCELEKNVYNRDHLLLMGFLTGTGSGNKYNDDFEHEGVNLKDNLLYFDNSCGEYERDFVLINYCPICGRKLS